jgi:hypothetical protein
MLHQFCTYCQHRNPGHAQFCERCQTLLPGITKATKDDVVKAGLTFGLAAFLLGLIPFFLFGNERLRLFGGLDAGLEAGKVFLFIAVMPAVCAALVGGVFGSRILTTARSGGAAAGYGFSTAIFALAGYLNWCFFIVLMMAEEMSLTTVLGIFFYAEFIGAVIGVFTFGPIGALVGWLLYRLNKPTP